MEADKAVIEEDARATQAEVRLALRRNPYFDFAEVGFQIAIVLASVAMLSGKRWAFHAGLAAADVAFALAANGSGLFVAVPGLDAAGH